MRTVGDVDVTGCGSTMQATAGRVCAGLRGPPVVEALE